MPRSAAYPDVAPHKPSRKNTLISEVWNKPVKSLAVLPGVLRRLQKNLDSRIQAIREEVACTRSEMGCPS
jgi:hypothetical protein